MKAKTRDKKNQTISDFGEQWTHFTENEGYYGSVDDLRNIFGPLLTIDSLRGKKVAEIGSGTGRVVNMMLDSGVSEITAIEPSEAFQVLRNNTCENADKIRYLNIRGEDIPEDADFDMVFAIGVIHHIEEPRPVIEAAFRSIKPGGKIVIWVYGREGNRLYLSFAAPLRKITVKLPHVVLNAIIYILNIFLDIYIVLCKYFPLPICSYMQNKLSRCSRRVRHLTIYDQLNPSYSKYYRKKEVEDLLKSAGFCNIRLYHRDGYSWTAIGTRPSQD